MATCQTVIKRSLRMLGVLPAGREPDDADAADGLEALQGLYLHLLASGTFGRVADVLVSDDYTAKENERVFAATGSTPIITGPQTIEDAAADNGVRPIRDGSLVLTPGGPSTHLYDSYSATWVDLEGLTLTGEAPFSALLGTGLAALLAAHVCADYGVELPRTVIALAAQAMSALTQRPISASTPTQAEYF